MVLVALATEYESVICVAKFDRGLDQCIEHNLQIERRAADNLEHIGRRGLLLQRLPQLTEQARVFDGDDGLSSEALHQRDLLVRKRTDILATHEKDTNQFVPLQHWNGHKGSHTPSFDGRYIFEAPFNIALLRCNIGDMNHRFGRHQRAEIMFRTGTERGVPT